VAGHFDVPRRAFDGGGGRAAWESTDGWKRRVAQSSDGRERMRRRRGGHVAGGECGLGRRAA
jgi:hypothetical protein